MPVLIDSCLLFEIWIIDLINFLLNFLCVINLWSLLLYSEIYESQWSEFHSISKVKSKIGFFLEKKDNLTFQFQKIWKQLFELLEFINIWVLKDKSFRISWDEDIGDIQIINTATVDRRSETSVEFLLRHAHEFQILLTVIATRINRIQLWHLVVAY